MKETRNERNDSDEEKTIYKIAIDLLMTILLLVIMARQLTGDSAHEWLGADLPKQMHIVLLLFSEGATQDEITL